MASAPVLETSAPDASPTAVDDAGVFTQFYSPLVLVLRDSLTERLRRCPQSLVDATSIIEQAETDLLEDLAFLGSRTLVCRFHERLTEWGLAPTTSGEVPLRPVGAPDTAYRRFAAELATGEGRKEVLAAVPGLGPLLETAVTRRYRLLAEVLDHWEADAAVTAGLGRLLRLETGHGDSHNGGRQVVVLHGSEGRLVHKPRSLMPERFFAELARLHNPLLPENIRLEPARVHDCGDYGWQPFLTHTPGVDAAGACRYYQRLGVYLALCHSLGSGDMHRENVLAVGEQPQLIDLETVLSRRPTPTGSDDATETLHRELEESVLGTLLLPTRIQGSPFDMNMSGVGTVREQTSQRWSGFALVGRGTDLLRYQRGSASMRHTTNLLMVDGRPVSPTDHVEDLRRGYELGHAAARRLANERASLLDRYAAAGMACRQILRATAVYSQLLEASTHPVYLGDDDRRRELFQKLPRSPLALQAGEAIRHAEIRALEEGDIPYFAARLDDSRLVANESTLVDDGHGTTLREDAATWERLWSTRPLVRDSHLIVSAMMTEQDDAWTPETDTSTFGAEIFAEEEPLQIARAVARHLATIALTSRDGKTASWLTALVDTERYCQLGPLNTSLYEGGGMIAFLADMAAHDGDETLVSLVAAAVKHHPVWASNTVSHSGLSGFIGGTGTVYLLDRLTAALHDADYSNQAQVLRDDMAEALAQLPPDQWDLIGGTAGAALAVLGSSTFGYGAGIAHLLATWGRELPLGGGTELGLAHGRAGAVLAAARIAASLRDADLAARARREALDLVGDAVALADDGAIGGGWCKGTSGILLGTSLALVGLGEAPTAIRDAVAPLARHLALTLEAEPALDVSICHGASGPIYVAEHLHRAGVLPEGHAQAEDALRRLARRARYGYRCGLAHSAGLATYMNGLSGLGHTALWVAGLDAPATTSFDPIPRRTDR